MQFRVPLCSVFQSMFVPFGVPFLVPVNVPFGIPFRVPVYVPFRVPGFSNDIILRSLYTCPFVTNVFILNYFSLSYIIQAQIA